MPCARPTHGCPRWIHNFRTCSASRLKARNSAARPKIQPSQATAALKTATDTLGPVGKLSLAGDRATLTLSNANGDQLKRWLVDARTTARARTVEAKLSRSAAGYSGTVVVALPSN